VLLSEAICGRFALHCYLGYVHQQSIYDYYLGIFQVASELKTPQLYAAIQEIVCYGTGTETPTGTIVTKFGSTNHKEYREVLINNDI
jgi:hypothetical protein